MEQLRAIWRCASPFECSLSTSLILRLDNLSCGNLFAPLPGEVDKTQTFVKALAEITTAKKVLLVSAQFDPLTERSARNIAKVDLIAAALVNCENLLNYDKIVLLGDALDALAKRTAALS